MNNDRAEIVIEMLVNTKTRQAITDYIDSYGDNVDWTGYSDREILEEVWRSDREAGEEENGILANMYTELGA